MPWSIDAYMTLGEIDERGRLFYSEVRAGTPRQTSKTTGLTLVPQVDRILHAEERGWPDGQVATFSMAHGSDARMKMRRLWMPRVERASELAEDWVKNELGNGFESIVFRNGRMTCFPPNGVAAHGDVLDDVSIDEAWAFVDDRAESGARPATITRASKVIRVSSTAGTNESLYWLDKVNDGRARVDARDTGHVYYLEYSADLTVDDPHNPEHWHRWMPALGYTIELPALIEEHDSISEELWLRGYCNLPGGSFAQIFDAARWAAAYVEKTKNEGKVWLAADASPGIDGAGRSASISAASYRDDGIHGEVLEHGAGVSWVADAIGRLTRERHVESLTLDSVGPLNSVLADIKAKAMCNIIMLDTNEVVAAHARYLDAVNDGTTHHRNQDVLNAAVAGAAKRLLGDGFAIKRRTSTADVTPLVSVILAHWQAALNPPRGPIRMWTR